MTINLDFYKNIPQKECRECGEHFEEQAESGVCVVMEQKRQ